MNFINVFEELDSLYDEEPIEEACAKEELTGAVREVLPYRLQGKQLKSVSFRTNGLFDIGDKYAITTSSSFPKAAGTTIEILDFVAPDDEKNTCYVSYNWIKDNETIKTVMTVDDMAALLKYSKYKKLNEELKEESDDEIEIVNDEEPVEDTPAEAAAVTEDPIKEEEIRQLVIECDKCGALAVMPEDKVVFDEESDLVNPEVECQFCEETAGYKVIGVMMPYEEEVEVVDDPAPEVVEPAEELSEEE